MDLMNVSYLEFEKTKNRSIIGINTFRRQIDQYRALDGAMICEITLICNEGIFVRYIFGTAATDSLPEIDAKFVSTIQMFVNENQVKGKIL
jgi:hypothetical protein